MGRVLGGFGEGLGRVWGGFWEGFGKVWEPFGRSRAFSALFLDFAGLCWSFLAFSCSSLPFLVFPSLFSPSLAFAGLCWVLTRVIIAGGERSSLALYLGFPCLPMLLLAHACFLLLRFFACCLAFSFEWYLGIPSLMLYSVFGCSLPCFVLSRFTLCQHFLKKIALPVHLLRQVSFRAIPNYFFAFFFDIDFL